MFQEEILNLFNDNKVITTELVRDALHIGSEKCASLNTELKRMCDKDTIRQIGRGGYGQGSYSG